VFRGIIGTILQAVDLAPHPLPLKITRDDTWQLTMLSYSAVLLFLLKPLPPPLLLWHSVNCGIDSSDVSFNFEYFCAGIINCQRK
jgi:hypothetical protein